MHGVYRGKKHKTTSMQIVVRSQPDRKSSVRKHSGSFDEDKEAEYDFSSVSTSCSSGQKDKHGAIPSAKTWNWFC